MQVEVSENWVTVGTIIGMLAFGAIGTFAKLYTRSREDERSAVSSTPAIAASAIGAAFVDRSTAQDIAAIREDVADLRRMAEDRQQHDDEDRIKRLAREAAREAVLSGQHGPRRKSED